ncbi:hypothetical protein MJM83_34530, partial [Salmonella enterica subsp. enterica serovar Montevideo]|nr:hypothetical protein [Salmonella enterica subsp. enterica serovar Montevideo]
SVGLAKIRHNFPDAVAVEMEATAIAHVCYNFNVPFVVVRAISAHPRMGFFLHQQSDLTRFLVVKSYNALKWCNLFQETAEWQA